MQYHHISDAFRKRSTPAFQNRKIYFSLIWRLKLKKGRHWRQMWMKRFEIVLRFSQCHRLCNRCNLKGKYQRHVCGLFVIVDENGWYMAKFLWLFIVLRNSLSRSSTGPVCNYCVAQDSYERLAMRWGGWMKEKGWKWWKGREKPWMFKIGLRQFNISKWDKFTWRLGYLIFWKGPAPNCGLFKKSSRLESGFLFQ